MQIRISHVFPCDPATYWATTDRPEVDQEMRQSTDSDFEVIEARKDGPKAHTRTRVTVRKELPGVMAKALGTPRLSYVQEVESDGAAFRTLWKVVPDVLKDRVKCSGTTRVVPHPQGCERIVEGSIEVGVPLVGGTIEKHIVGELEKSWGAAADVLRRHLPRA